MEYLIKIFKWLTVAEERNKFRSKTSGFSLFYRLDFRTMGMFYLSIYSTFITRKKF